MTFRFLCAFLLAGGMASPLAAAEMKQLDPGIDTTTTDLSLRIGLGGIVQPTWEGADDYDVVPWPIVSLEYLRLPGIGEFGGRTVGFSIGPSFGFVGKRDQFDDAALIGLGDVDAAFELGLKATYEVDWWGAYAALRYGFGGFEGIVGEAALYAVWRPTDAFVMRVGPNLSFAGSDYFDTYFSVTPVQSFLSGLPVYDAGSGIKNVGIAAVAAYSLTERVDVNMTAGYQRLVSGAADSPIVTVAGSRDQFFVGLGLSYRLDLDLFR